MKEILKEFEYLPRLSEFVEDVKYNPLLFQDRIIDYTDLITQPLTKGMFVPCDEEGNVLDKPSIQVMNNFKSGGGFFLRDRINQFLQAKDRVIFEGWDYLTVNSLEGLETIEDAINANVKLKYIG